MQNKRIFRGGFALPTVLIASVVMLTILAVSVTSVATVRTSLKTQYYEQLAKAAGEAGVAFAKACLSKNGNVPLWKENKPLAPHTDCAGNSLLDNGSFNSLIVAGGGSGGGSTAGGGGGGGVIETNSFALNTGSYPVAIGAGGAASGNQGAGRDGGNTSFNGIIAQGGGGGAHTATGGIITSGRAGGSGGGGQTYTSPSGPGAGNPGQGYAGGPITGVGSQSTTGGGGAGGVGLTTAVPTGGGDGGPGKLSTISGSASYYGGGGGGGGGTAGACGGGAGRGGIGGGGNGGDVGLSGQTNTGGGGGGGWCYASGNGGAGGSGVVYVSYPNNAGIVASGGNNIYVSGAYKIHRFTSAGIFNVSTVSPSSCPTDPRCSVMANENIRSSFSVGAINVDTQGRAISIPNTGYVELLRESTGAVWRTYRQPSVQAAVAPDLCSGAATSGLGWSNAVHTATQEAIPGASTARSISAVDGSLSSGKMYFRKDFTVTEAGAYNVALLTSTPNSYAEAYVDGTARGSSRGGLTNTPVTLSVGCHTITVQLTNKTLLAQASRFTAAIQKDNATPIVASDSSWRVSTGGSVHFSEVDYAADSDIWSPVTYMDPVTDSSWISASSDNFTQYISAQCTTTCPPNSSTYFRNSREFVTTGNTEVLVTALCDDDCSIYVDGNLVIESSPWPYKNQQTLTLTAGTHQVGVRLYNAGTVPNPAKFALAIYDKSNSDVLVRSDLHWLTANNVWSPGKNLDNDPTSYEDSFRPSPSEIAFPVTADILVVGGGGGAASNAAGGGGGGGARYYKDVPMTTGSKSIAIGAGGIGGASSTGVPSGGGGSQYMNTSYRALGGGAGAPRSSSLIMASGANGFATGGGGAGAFQTANHTGGAGIFGFGGAGGNGSPMDAGCGARGGGGGGAGGGGTNGVANTTTGNGGPGYITYITGSRLAFAGGGAGVGVCGGPLGLSTDGAGASSDGASAGANTGGGGTPSSGGTTGGNGGSGVVIIRVKTGSMTVSTTGSPAVSNVTIGGIPYTIYRYNASGTFNPTSLIP